MVYRRPARNLFGESVADWSQSYGYFTLTPRAEGFSLARPERYPGRHQPCPCRRDQREVLPGQWAGAPHRSCVGGRPSRRRGIQYGEGCETSTRCRHTASCGCPSCVTPRPVKRPPGVSRPDPEYSGRGDTSAEKVG